jgi:phage terminase large subunit
VGDEDKPMYANYFMATTNPTKNWINSKLVRPLHLFKTTGTVLPELLKDERLYKETGQVKPIIDLLEGSTYDNAANLPPGFIERLENTYTGVMREKFMYGKWDVAEDLVYPMFNYAVHVVPHNEMMDRLKESKGKYSVHWTESLDYGISSPSCYLCGFYDEYGILNICDGWYESELHVRQQADKIKDMRFKYGISTTSKVISDPALFRRALVDTTVNDLFDKQGIMLEKGNNNVLGGIGKVAEALTINPIKSNPYSKTEGCPEVIFSDKLQFLIDEIVDYRWKKGKDGESLDMPIDKNDHAMDSLKYMLTYKSKIANIIKQKIDFSSEILKWRES